MYGKTDNGPKDVLRMTRGGVKVGLADSALLHAKQSFKKNNFLRVKGFLDQGLLKQMQDYIRQGAFYEKIDKGIAKESCMRQNAAYDALQFLSQEAALFRWVESVTGCPCIRRFDGRIFRFVPGQDHYDSWHDDAKKNEARVVGMSVNLSEKPFCGGALQLRRKKSKTMFLDYANTGFGDAVFFRVHHTLEHRVMPVTGKNPRVVFVGWFIAETKKMRTRNMTPRFSLRKAGLL